MSTSPEFDYIVVGGGAAGFVPPLSRTRIIAQWQTISGPQGNVLGEGSSIKCQTSSSRTRGNSMRKTNPNSLFFAVISPPIALIELSEIDNPNPVPLPGAFVV